MYHVNKDVVLKDKKNTEKMKGEEKEDKFKKSLTMDKVECLTTCSKTKPPNTVTKNKTMTKHNLAMTIRREGDLNNKCMWERESESHKLWWKEFRANHKKKLMKCIDENFSKEDKIKSCSHHHKIIKLMQFNVKWEKRKMLSIQYWKKLNIIKRPKIKSLKFKSLLLWQWKRSILERFLSKPKIKELSNKVFKDLLMSISKKLTNCSMKTIPTFLLSEKLNKLNSNKTLISELKREFMKMI